MTVSFVNLVKDEKNTWELAGEFGGRRSLRNQVIAGILREFTLPNQRWDIFRAGAVKRTEEPAPLKRCGQEVLNQLDKGESKK